MRPPSRDRLSRQDNIKMVLEDIVWEFMDWIRLIQVRAHWSVVVYTGTNLRVL
jgi:hypothetical protein